MYNDFIIRFKMKLKLIAGLMVAAAMVSCVGNGKTADGGVGSEDASQSVADVNITGQWFIENIVFDDSTYVRPSEEVPGTAQYIVFTDSTYSIMTNCNSISGTVAISGDSIRLGDGMMTELACDNMATEDALRKILPEIAAVDVENDSIVRLNCDPSPWYMVLRKAKTEVK